MGVYRSYFKRSNTLIEDSRINNSQNPVTEISFGTSSATPSRFIFEIDLDPLISKISSGAVFQTNITGHTLNMTNTISFRSDLVGAKFPDQITERAASFTLELFTINEQWDEGNGYDFIYVDEEFPNISPQASNWFDRKTGVAWTEAGAFITGATGTSQILATQSFDKGNEDISMDITNYINDIITGGTTGTTLGIRFISSIESGATKNRQAVAFHAKNTHTFFEPYIQTEYNDIILDDRNYFFMDKNNELFLYASVGGVLEDIAVSAVTIFDYEDKLYNIITSGSSIVKIDKGIYRIIVNIPSATYLDAVLFTDRWTIIQNGLTKQIDQEFYLISPDNYYNFDLSNRVISDNYFFTFFGIRESEKIIRGDIRKILVEVKELYPNQDANTPIDIEYRLYVTQTDNKQVSVIPYTKVSRILSGYEFNIDTSWLIPQEYTLELRMNNGNIYDTKDSLKFSVVSDEITRP